MQTTSSDRILRMFNAGMILLVPVVLVFWFFNLFEDTPYSSPIELGEDFMRPASPDDLDRVTGGQNVIRLVFAGDIMQHRGQIGDDFHSSYAEVRPVVGRADLAIANLEFPVVSTKPPGPPIGSTQFNGSPAHLQALQESGFDVLVTANNHSFDQGLGGILSTLEQIQADGMEAIGTDESIEKLEVPRLFDVGPLKIGIYAYAYTINPQVDSEGEVTYPPRGLPVFTLNFSDWQGDWRDQGRKLFSRHSEAARRAGADLLVAYCHWGEEWHFAPDPEQRRAARDLIDSGFDLVVGSHSHVLQGTEIYRDKLIAYGLGTLNSDFHPWKTRTAALLEVVVSASPVPRVVDFGFYPTFVEREGHRVTLLASPDSEEGDRHQARLLAEKILGSAVRDPGENPQ